MILAFKSNNKILWFPAADQFIFIEFADFRIQNYRPSDNAYEKSLEIFQLNRLNSPLQSKSSCLRLVQAAMSDGV